MMHKYNSRDDFQVNPIYSNNKMRTQSLEHRGKFQALPENHQWHTPLYKDLLTNVVPLRHQFRLIKDVDVRKEMASQEFGYWNTYLETRKDEIANLPKFKSDLEANVDYQFDHNDAKLEFSHQISDTDMAQLKEFFDRFKVSYFLLFSLNYLCYRIIQRTKQHHIE